MSIPSSSPRKPAAEGFSGLDGLATSDICDTSLLTVTDAFTNRESSDTTEIPSCTRAAAMSEPSALLRTSTAIWLGTMLLSRRLWTDDTTSPISSSVKTASTRPWASSLLRTSCFTPL